MYHSCFSRDSVAMWVLSVQKQTSIPQCRMAAAVQSSDGGQVGALAATMSSAGTPLLYMQSSHLSLFSSSEKKHEHFLDPKLIQGQVFFIIQCNFCLFCLALAKIALVPSCQKSVCSRLLIGIHKRCTT